MVVMKLKLLYVAKAEVRPDMHNYTFITHIFCIYLVTRLNY